MTVTRTVHSLSCPFCRRTPPVSTVRRGRLADGGTMYTRYYGCLCGASCKSIEVSRGPGRSEFCDQWSPAKSSG